MPPAPSHREAKEGKGQGGPGPSRTRGSYIYRGEFRQNIEDLMYAFGDVDKPDAVSVALLEDMTLTFLVDLCHRARPQPYKIPMPSNQATLNSIAAGFLQESGGLGPNATAAAAAAAASSSSSAGGDRKGQPTVATTSTNAKDRGNNKLIGGGSNTGNTRIAPTAGSTTSTMAMAPRAAPHPFVGRTRMTVEDLKFACRKDRKMSSRIEELLYLDKVITDAQKTFKNPEEEAVEDKDV